MTTRSIFALLCFAVLNAPTYAAPTRTELISVRRLDVDQLSANKDSGGPSISQGGRYVAFSSTATDLVGEDTNGSSDVFVYDGITDGVERVSVDSSGAQAQGTSDQAAISANGRFVAFASDAPDLVPNDTNEGPDIFVHDRRTHTTTRVSINSSGHEALFFDSDFESPASGRPSISPDGRYVTFDSNAWNLIRQRIDNEFEDVFVHDRETGATTQVSLTSSSALANGLSYNPSISADGRFVAFSSFATNLSVNDTNEDQDIFVRDRKLGTTTRVSLSSDGVPAERGSASPAISGDGRWIAFVSGATTLVPNDTNGSADIFVYERTTATVSRVSLSSSGGQANASSTAPAISADGRIVVFQSLASNLVRGDTNGSLDPLVNRYDVFIHDRQSGATRRINIDSKSRQVAGDSGSPAVSADGRVIAFDSSASKLAPGDENGSRDVFIRDRRAASTTLASIAAVFSQTAPGVNATGPRFPVPGNGPGTRVISSTGRYVAFWSNASTLVKGDTNGVADIFLRDRHAGKTRRVSVDTRAIQANGDSSDPTVSGDGRYVAFSSFASNLVADDTNRTQDIFVRDTGTHTTSRVSVGSDGSQGLGGSGQPSISNHGRYIAFVSAASNFAVGGNPDIGLVYVRDRRLGTTTPVSVAANGAQPNGHSLGPSISGNGRYVAFSSDATNLVAGGTGDTPKLFVRDLLLSKTTLVSVNLNGVSVRGFYPSLSANGRFVAFWTGDGILVRDWFLGITTRADLAWDGRPASFSNGQPSISGNGRYVAFTSLDDGLVPDDRNITYDVFVRDRKKGTTTRVSVDSQGGQTTRFQLSELPSISRDGLSVAFTSDVSNLAADDVNDSPDVFVYERAQDDP